MMRTSRVLLIASLKDMRGSRDLRSRMTRKREKVKVKRSFYEHESLERGFLLNAAGHESECLRLSICSEDVKGQLEKDGKHSRVMLSASRATGDANAAISYFEENVDFLTKVPKDDLEITHTLSVSLNKIGDLKYYADDLQAARSYYCKALEFCRNVINHHSAVPSQVIDVATSLTKVADVDRNFGNEDAATSGFQEAIKMLESLTISAQELGLEQRRISVLEFLDGQLAKK